MKIRNIKIEHIIILILVLLLFAHKLRRTSANTVTTRVEKATVMIHKMDSIHKLFKEYKNIKPKVVYVKSSNDVLKIISEYEARLDQLKPGEEVLQLNEYKDTLQNKDITIYSTVLTDGKVYENKLKYDFKYPVITETTIEEVKVPKSGMFVYSGVGGNSTELSAINIGLQYVHKNKWFVGYGINLKNTPSPTHQIQFGVKLF